MIHMIQWYIWYNDTYATMIPMIQWYIWYNDTYDTMSDEFAWVDQFVRCYKQNDQNVGKSLQL